MVLTLFAGLQSVMAVSASHPARAAEGAQGGEAEARQHYQRGESDFKAGRFNEALEAYQAGYEAAPLPGFLVNIAHCYRRMGDLRKARGSYHRFVLVAPDSPLVPEVRQLIAEIDGMLRDLDEPAAPAPAPLSPNLAAASAPAAGGAVTPPALDFSQASGRNASSTSPGSSLSVQASATAPAESSAGADSGAGRRKWWLWGAVAATVVGGSVAAWALLSTPDRTIVHDGSLATLRR